MRDDSYFSFIYLNVFSFECLLSSLVLLISMVFQRKNGFSFILYGVNLTFDFNFNRPIELFFVLSKSNIVLFKRKHHKKHIIFNGTMQRFPNFVNM